MPRTRERGAQGHDVEVCPCSWAFCCIFVLRSEVDVNFQLSVATCKARAVQTTANIGLVAHKNKNKTKKSNRITMICTENTLKHFMHSPIKEMGRRVYGTLPVAKQLSLEIDIGYLS